MMVSMPLDDDGFLRRECPTCEREFKWFHGETAERPADFLEPENKFCPYCGVPSGPDTWWTKAQLEYATGMVAGPAVVEAAEELQRSFGRVGGLVEIRVTADVAPPPPPLTEPNDMIMVGPPCHPFEPLKVDESWQGPICCLMCGHEFLV